MLLRENGFTVYAPDRICKVRNEDSFRGKKASDNGIPRTFFQDVFFVTLKHGWIYRKQRMLTRMDEKNGFKATENGFLDEMTFSFLFGSNVSFFVSHAKKIRNLDQFPSRYNKKEKACWQNKLRSGRH